MRWALFVLLGLASCAKQNDDPEGAKQLYAKVTEGAGFRAWRRTPGFSTRKPSFTAHSDAVEIFVNHPIAKAIDGKTVLSEWPVGSIVVKEGFDRGGDRALVAIMEKRAAGWFWVETDEDGEPVYSGRPSVCVDCHDNRASHSDWVYSFGLPR